MRKALLAVMFGFFAVTATAGQDKLIVLTFDDGPVKSVLFGKDGLTEVLRLPDGSMIPAHFFVQGWLATDDRESVRMLAQMGFLVENHTYGHDNLKVLYATGGQAGILRSLERTSIIVERMTGRRPRYFRPPYWSINAETRKIVIDAGYKVVELERPDINTVDYEDQAKKRDASVLVERVQRVVRRRERQGVYRHVLGCHELPVTVKALKQLIPYFSQKGYRFGTLDDYFGTTVALKKSELQSISLQASVSRDDSFPFPGNNPDDGIRAAYFGADALYSKRVLSRVTEAIRINNLNAVVIDFKVDIVQNNDNMRKLVAHFRERNLYLIARVVVFQDHRLAKRRPHLALRHSDGSLWYSGARAWMRYWVDPASPEVLEYTIQASKQAIDMGFDEVNFDYIRFPSDGKMQDLVYPVWDGVTPKYEVMRKFFAGLTGALRQYSPKTKLSVDIFGEAFAYGGEPGVGQRLEDLARYFDVIAPMAYPSHYRCGEFRLKDPTADPYIVYYRTLEWGLRRLGGYGFKGAVRPWIQDFSIASIYGCGQKIIYGPEMVRAQIRAAIDCGVTGFMLWNGSSSYTVLPIKPE